jgi:excisionase family DNA binding protein
MDTLLSVNEAARRLGGISKWTVHAWLSQGRLQRTKVGGRTMIRESELTKVIEDGGKSPTRPHVKHPEQVGGCTMIRGGQLDKEVEEGGNFPAPYPPEHREQTKTEEPRAMATRVRRARMRRNESD